VPVRLLHVSDLHVGTPDDASVHASLEVLVSRLDPAVIVASGDLTHRGRAAQHERAASFLRAFGRPLVVVPGNHDIPYTFPGRFTRTFAEFRHWWETTEPVYASADVHIVGLNSVRAWRRESGGLGRAQLAGAVERLGGAAPGALRVVVLHHHLLGAPWRSRKRPVSRRSRVLASLVSGGADLILAGHVHQAAVSERHEFEVIAGKVRGVVVSIAPGLGQPRPNRHGEARGLHVYECDADTIRVHTYVWRDDDWGLTAIRTFARGREPLRVESAS
jgi:3',5'-cyclic AMP phosphodiesterase CpdA